MLGTKEQMIQKIYEGTYSLEIRWLVTSSTFHEPSESYRVKEYRWEDDMLILKTLEDNTIYLPKYRIKSILIQGPHRAGA